MVDFVSLFTINFMCMTSYFHVISRLAHRIGGNRVGCKSSLLVKVESDSKEDDMSFSHDQCPKTDGGVAKNVVRANALKSENPLFKVVIHPSYVNLKRFFAKLVWRYTLQNPPMSFC